MSALESDSEDVCPNCGHYARLVESSGWCPQCTLAHNPDLKICKSCGKFYPKSHQVNKCWDCRREEWLTKHADAIEKYMLDGNTFTASCKLVADDLRPTCLSCGQKIKGGHEDSKFCRTNAKCEKKARTYTTLKLTGLSPDVALAIATDRVTVFDSI